MNYTTTTNIVFTLRDDESTKMSYVMDRNSRTKITLPRAYFLPHIKKFLNMKSFYLVNNITDA